MFTTALPVARVGGQHRQEHQRVAGRPRRPAWRLRHCIKNAR
jgi:hypothetical protein